MEPMERVKPVRQEESAADRLVDKREKYRTDIRKSSKKELLLNRRKVLMDVLREQIIHHLSDMFRGLSEDNTLSLLENLEMEVVSEEFNVKLLGLQLESKLLGLLRQPGVLLQMKASAVRVLCELSKYASEEGMSIVSVDTINLLFEQLQTYSFGIRFECKYLLQVLALLGHLAGPQHNEQVYRRLVELNLNSLVLKKIVHKDHSDIIVMEEDGVEVMRLLCRIRRMLIYNTFEIDFALKALSDMVEEYTQYDGLSFKEYCRAIIAVIRKCGERSQASADLAKIAELAESTDLFVNFESYFQRIKGEELSLFLMVLDEVEHHLKDVVKGLLSFIPLPFLLHCVKQGDHSALNVLGNIMESICEYYQEQETFNQELSDILFKELDRRTNKYSCLVAIEGITSSYSSWPGMVELLLNNELISKMSEMLNVEGPGIKDLLTVLKILQNLVKYSKVKMEDRIPRTFNSVGLIRQLQALQDHENKKVYSIAASILNQSRLSKSELEHD